ncbi:MAG: M24 family metallopeptidase [Candidatus Bipolaricaulota bacterium]
MQIFLSEQELSRHKTAVAQEMEANELDLFCLFGPKSIFYLTGIHTIQTERPMALIFDGSKTTFFAPLLEREHLKELGGADDIITYDEYPGERHPLEILADQIRERSPVAVGADSDGYGGGYGYQGPALTELLEVKVEILPQLVRQLREIKSEEEIELIKESARWGNLAHRFLQDLTCPGLKENEISTKASLKASQAMIKTLGSEYYPVKGASLPASAGFRGQIGKGSALPHALTTNETIEKGDVLVTGASADIGGYTSELERTMIVGEPTERQRKFFEFMIQAQEVAFEKIKPGNKFSDVDQAVSDFFRDNELVDYWRHHTGHSIGIGGHEAPYFDTGDDRELKPGMVVTIEPGIYVPGFAGFRHSDTAVVTDKGMELITYYPRNLEALVIE